MCVKFSVIKLCVDDPAACRDIKFIAGSSSIQFLCNIMESFFPHIESSMESLKEVEKFIGK